MRPDTKFLSFVLVPLGAWAGAGVAATTAPYLPDASSAAPKAARVLGPGPKVVYPPISYNAPPDIPVGAGNANITQAAVFAWQEFIALNWPAAVGPQYAGSNQRGMPNTALKFGDDVVGSNAINQPVVWETYRAKVETFPGTAVPPGYPNSSNANN